MSTDDKKGAKRQQARQSGAGDFESPYANTSAEMDATTGSIAGCVFYETGTSGYDANKPHLKGLQVRLTFEQSTYGRPITAITDSNGCYSFDGLAAGTYCLQFPESICITYAQPATTDTSASADPYPAEVTGEEQSFESSEPSASVRPFAPYVSPNVLQAAPCQATSIKLEPSGSCGNTVCVRINGDTQTVNFGYELPASCIFGYVCRETDIDEICDKTRARNLTTSGSTTVRQPINGVPVALFSDGVPVARTLTDETGYYQFQKVGCGDFSLQFPLEFGGESLTLASDTLTIFVLPGVEVGPLNITYGDPLATITGKFQLASGVGLSGLTATLVEVRPAPGLAPLTLSATSNETGDFTFYNVSPGSWELVVPNEVDGGIGGIKFCLDPATKPRCPFNVCGSMTIPTLVFNSGFLIGAIASQIQQLIHAKPGCCAPQAVQPVLTALPVSGATGSLQFGNLVNQSLTDILGSSISTNPTRIVEQLTAAFQQEQVNGKTSYTWQRRGAAAPDSPQAAQGTQATFSRQAKDIQDTINSLLDAVQPTFLDPDEEEIDPLKEDIRALLGNIVTEFGRGGGALQPRVNVLIANLKRDIDGLKTALGINPLVPPEREMDIGEREENEANFALLGVYVNDLENAWLSYKTAINAFGTAAQITTFKGTALARMLWAIDAIPSTIQEVYAAMDFAGFGPVDRRVTAIGPSSATVEQVLMWIETSASTDWPNLLVRGGARLNEVEAVKQEAAAQAAALTTLTNGIGQIIQAGAGTVTQSLDELGRELTLVLNLATRIKPEFL